MNGTRSLPSRTHLTDRTTPLKIRTITCTRCRLSNGCLVSVRVIAGYWLLREQSFYQWPSGLGVILQVGEEGDLPPIPTDFPKCGSFVGPEFFLM